MESKTAYPSIGAPVRKKIVAGIGAGTYTDIVNIYGPAEAAEGETVDIIIRVENTWSGPLHVYCVGMANSNRFIDWPDEWIPAGGTHDFSGSFVMPDQGVDIKGFAYYEDVDGNLHPDDDMTVHINLTALQPEFRNFGITDYSLV